MRKAFFFVAAAAAVLSSCSSDDALQSGTGINDNRVAIQLGVGSPVSASRGTGTVGDIADPNNAPSNVWKGQKLNVSMFNHGELVYALEENSTNAIYENTVFWAPSDVESGLATDTTYRVKYYPTTGNYDFVGYRVDDAAAPTATPQFAGDNNDSLVIDVTIDGSQDIMTADAPVSQAEIANLTAANANRGDDYFSAFSARYGVQPNLVFQHKLTRFTFSVYAQDRGCCDATHGIKVDSIKLVSPNQAQLTVAKVVNGRVVPGDLIFNDTDIKDDSLSLKQRPASGDQSENLDSLVSVALQWDATADTAIVDKVGEAILAAPGQTVYPLVIYLSQNVSKFDSNYQPAQGEATDTIICSVVPTTVRLQSGAPFEAGTSYNVKIKIAGLERIEITTTLTAWKDGGEIEIHPFDEDIQ